MNAPGHPGLYLSSTSGASSDGSTLYNRIAQPVTARREKRRGDRPWRIRSHLAEAGEATLRQATAKGVAGKLMPAFSKSDGGTLTDQQIDNLVQGILQTWSRTDHSRRRAAAVLCGRREERSQARATSLWRVLRPMPRGRRQRPKSCRRKRGFGFDCRSLLSGTDQRSKSAEHHPRRRPDLGMPDWRSDASGPGSRAMTDQQITDVVAWLATHRAASQE